MSLHRADTELRLISSTHPCQIHPRKFCENDTSTVHDTRHCTVLINELHRRLFLLFGNRPFRSFLVSSNYEEDSFLSSRNFLISRDGFEGSPSRLGKRKAYEANVDPIPRLKEPRLGTYVPN